jgi:hypothetical protein
MLAQEAYENEGMGDPDLDEDNDDISSEDSKSD